MTESATFSVIISGNVQEGFEPAQVLEAFATLSKVPPEKAGGLLKRPRVIKEGTDLDTAKRYKRKLERIGLVVILKEHAPALEQGPSGLSLVPIHERAEPEPALQIHPQGPRSATIGCPKCDTKQPVGTPQCGGCGVYLHKVLNVPTAGAASQSRSSCVAEGAAPADGEYLSGVSLAAGAAAALVGALMWKLIAMASGYELGLVAWAIGGGVGFVVAATGSSGQKAGAVCGILALLAIMGGKYMVYSELKDDLVETLGLSNNEARYRYDEEMAAIERYQQVKDDDSLRRFMIDHGYSVGDEPEAVTREELEDFRESDATRLAGYAHNRPTFDEWYHENVGATLEQVSTFGMMKEDFGLVDGVFLLLGVTTAFRLGFGRGVG